MEITVSEEVIKVIIKELEKRGYEVTKPKVENPFPQYGDEYFYVQSDGSIDFNIWTNTNGDKRCRDIGNIYRTEEDAQFVVERRKVRAELYKRAIHGPIVWNDDTSYWHLVYNITSHELFPGLAKGYVTDDIFFNTAADVQRAIDAVGEDRILKYMMGVVRC